VLANDCLASNDGAKVTATVLLEISAVFDTIDREILLACLETGRDNTVTYRSPQRQQEVKEKSQVLGYKNELVRDNSKI